MTCLHPELTGYSDPNDYSSVWSIQYDNINFLFLADLSALYSEKLPPNKYHFLRLGHHGAITSISSDLLKQLRPELAVISSGKGNPFGHPSPGTLALLKDFKIRFLRTDQLGTMVFSSDGTTLLA